MLEAVDVSKRFVLHHNRTRTIRERVDRFFSASKGDRPKNEEFWALRDVNLKVARGDAIGLVGENGSGKTTLLRLFARTLEPTHGAIHVRGSVAAVIELGLGFHPELTGEQNIYLNASLFGFKKSQIASMFAEIVDFSELEGFIDVPIKAYSSGMQARLAISIAFQLRPETLLLDEVLAVGDARFKRRCVERVMELRERGTTIVFVSHSPSQVRRLCDSAAWLDEGRIVSFGKVDHVLDMYDGERKSAVDE